MAGFNEAGFEIGEGDGVKIGTKDNDEVKAGRELVLLSAKEGANEAFAVIALNSLADSATGDHPEAGGLFGQVLMLEELHNKKPAVNSSASTADLLKFAQ